MDSPILVPNNSELWKAFNFLVVSLSVCHILHCRVLLPAYRTHETIYRLRPIPHKARRIFLGWKVVHVFVYGKPHYFDGIRGWVQLAVSSKIFGEGCLWILAAVFSTQVFALCVNLEEQLNLHS